MLYDKKAVTKKFTSANFTVSLEPTSSSDFYYMTIKKDGLIIIRRLYTIQEEKNV